MNAESSKVEPKKYDPDERLISHMKKKQHFLNKRRQLEKRQEELENERIKNPKRLLSATNEKKLQNIMNELETIGNQLDLLKDPKKRILNDIIFPSMANICFFFEALYEFPELKDNFESDVRQLLGIRRLHPRMGNYAFVFVTLIHSMISTKKEYEQNDFRIRLVNELQKQVLYKFQGLSHKAFPVEIAFRAVNQDVERAAAWTELMASNIKDEYDFEDPKHSPDVPEEIPREYLRIERKRRKYKEDRKAERVETWDKFSHKPHRTFDFNVRELIEKE